MMRVISGIYGGRKIKVPGSSDIRPTSDFIREALFNILGERVRGGRFLDLYAGSGSVGIGGCPVCGKKKAPHKKW